MQYKIDVFTDNCGILNQFCRAWESLKLNCAHQFLMYADGVTVLGVGIRTVQLNTRAVVIASKETKLEASADKIKYIVMSPDQNAGRSRNIKTDNSSFARVEQFNYLGTTLTNQNSIQEEIKSVLVRECLLSFGAESFVFQFAIQKFKD